MRHVSLLEENSWRSKKLENGTREKRISNVFRMKDLIYSNLPLSKEKKKQKKNMLRKLKKLDLRKLNTRKEPLPKFKERELRYSVKCIRLEKTLKLKEKEEIL